MSLVIGINIQRECMVFQEGRHCFECAISHVLENEGVFTKWREYDGSIILQSPASNGLFSQPSAATQDTLRPVYNIHAQCIDSV